MGDQPPWLMPEPTRIRSRTPEQLLQSERLPQPAPTTVSRTHDDVEPWPLSLDEAIRIALDNSEVVRVLAGITATSSGRTIYDPAIAHTEIDRQQARFDPSIDIRNTFNRFESPQALPDPFDPTATIIDGTRTDDYNLNLGLSKQLTTGGTASLGVNSNPTRFRPGTFPLNPQNRSSVDFGLTQPLLQGGGLAANLAPIVIARIETERSFFQFKDGIQNLVNGVVTAYWSLVLARTDVWARERQVEQSTWAYEQADSNQRVGRSNIADVAQARVALANFRANLIAARANVLQSEAALRNIMGLPPTDGMQIEPISPPTRTRLQFDWDELIGLAELNRPDIVELKLIIEADEQLLLQARNQALPRVDATALYRWNGLDGEMPSGAFVSSRSGQFTDWTLGINFSVPLWLRESRAVLRRQELVIERDWANLEQGVHNATHRVAVSVRNLDQLYDQYDAFSENRAAAQENLQAQSARWKSGLGLLLNVLQAIADWGNSVSAQAQSLTQYNSELANLELETGSILEAHGIRFCEERYGSLGPLGPLQSYRLYPRALRPRENEPRYPVSDKPAEEFFDLERPVELRRSRAPAG